MSPAILFWDLTRLATTYQAIDNMLHALILYSSACSQHSKCRTQSSQKRKYHGSSKLPKKKLQLRFTSRSNGATRTLPPSSSSTKTTSQPARGADGHNSSWARLHNSRLSCSCGICLPTKSMPVSGCVPCASRRAAKPSPRNTPCLVHEPAFFSDVTFLRPTSYQ